MVKIATKPDFPRMQFNCLEAMDLVLRLEAKLAGNQSLHALPIRKAISNKEPAVKIIKMVADLIKDNKQSMIDMIGDLLVSKIIRFK